MPAADKLNPPIQYNHIWLIIGLLLLLLLPLWYIVLRWITRRKPYKTLDNFTKLPTGAELERLKEKYLRMIDEIYERYLNKEITLRDTHQQLSMTVRYFIYEVTHIPAPTMTLSDIKKESYPYVTKLITEYYAAEFAAIGSGDPHESVESAKKVIRLWV